MPTARLRIVDADAPNGFGAGRPRRCTVCLTTGALALPHDELGALCAHCIASVANRTTPLASAAADLVLVADVCTKVIWGVAAFFLVSSIIGVPADVVAMTTLTIVLLVTATKPLLAIADRGFVAFCTRPPDWPTSTRCRVTNQPSALAGLLLDAAADEQTVASRWQIAHMWFDPDTRRPPRGHGLPWEFIEDGPDVMQPNRNVARQSLIDRARRRGPLRRRHQAGRSLGATPIPIGNQEGALSGISKRGWRISSTWMLSGSLK